MAADAGKKRPEKIFRISSRAREVEIDFPQYYDAVEVDCLELYAQSLLRCRDYRNYYLVFSAPRGKGYRRKWSYTPMEGDESFTLTLSVYSSARLLLAQASVEIRVHPLPRRPDRPLHFLCVGDSLTAGGVWPRELYRRLTQPSESTRGDTALCPEQPCAALGSENIRFLGDCSAELEGVGGVHFEGRGGWTWEHYTGMGVPQYWLQVVSGMKADTASEQSLWTDEDGVAWQLETIDREKGRLKMKTPYGQAPGRMAASGRLRYLSGGGSREEICYDGFETESNNPFYHQEAGCNDFARYAARMGAPGIDCCITLLTWNGTKEISQVVAQGKVFVDRLHQQYPNCKILLMGLQVPNEDGMGESYGSSEVWNYFVMEQYVHDLNRAYEDWCREPAYRAFLSFVQISGQFDTEYGGAFDGRPANPRSAERERLGINGVHPAPQGYLQIADAAFRRVAGLMEQGSLSGG